MIIMKFGGSSVANSAAMEKVVGIIRQYAGKPLLVVLSACSGVTDKLLEMIRTASAGNLEDSLGLIDWISKFFFALDPAFNCFSLSIANSIRGNTS